MRSTPRKIIPKQTISPSLREKVAIQTNPPGLGDQLAALFSSGGITEARYKKLKAWLGLTPNCGCKERRERLNRLSRWLARRS